MNISRFVSVLAVFVGVLAVTEAHALSEADQALYAQAFEEVEEGNWQDAYGLAARASDQRLAEVIYWLDLQDTETEEPFSEILGFMLDHPDWPRLRTLRGIAEEAMPDDLPANDVIAYFGAYPPVETAGIVRYGLALIRSGQDAEATALVRSAWVADDFSASEEADFLKYFRSRLTLDDHLARLDRLLWEGKTFSAKRMLNRVGQDQAALAFARITLRSAEPGVDGAINRVPAELRDDPGLIFERLRWRRVKGFDDSAAELLMPSPDELVYPDLWARERLILARRYLDNDDAATAYRLLADHGNTNGAFHHEVDWLAGWVALRKLDEPAVALDHFMTFYEGVGYPISRSRGAYWAGRAAEAMGDMEQARVWYDLAADHGNTFYGQLGAEKLDVAPRFAEVPEPTEAEVNAFAADELVTLVRLLDEVGARDQVRRFLLHIGDRADSPATLHLSAQLALVLGRPDLAVSIAKAGVRRGTVLVYAGYPMIDLPTESTVDPALALAVIRQESSFDPGAISSAGARGLMQLMPATAQGVADDLGIYHTRAKLTSDPLHNMRLGTAYMAELLDAQGGSYVRAIAAYNAGPSRVYRWINEYGDPTAPGTDIVDWIEQIPFSETRNYVQRVLEALIVYRVLHGVQTASLNDSLTGHCAAMC